MRRSTTRTTAKSDGNRVQQSCYTAIERERGRGYQAASYKCFHDAQKWILGLKASWGREQSMGTTGQ